MSDSLVFGYAVVLIDVALWRFKVPEQRRFRVYCFGSRSLPCSRRAFSPRASAPSDRLRILKRRCFTKRRRP